MCWQLRGTKSNESWETPPIHSTMSWSREGGHLQPEAHAAQVQKCLKVVSSWTVVPYTHFEASISCCCFCFVVG